MDRGLELAHLPNFAPQLLPECSWANLTGVLLPSWQLRKPVVEKMRRDRINSSIEQLKVLLEKEFQRHQPNSKLEKADILEVTVNYLKQQQGEFWADFCQYQRRAQLVWHFPGLPPATNIFEDILSLNLEVLFSYHVSMACSHWSASISWPVPCQLFIVQNVSLPLFVCKEQMDERVQCSFIGIFFG